jgi:hypothetical protein
MRGVIRTRDLVKMMIPHLAGDVIGNGRDGPVLAEPRLPSTPVTLTAQALNINSPSVHTLSP